MNTESVTCQHRDVIAFAGVDLGEELGGHTIALRQAVEVGATLCGPMICA